MTFYEMKQYKWAESREANFVDDPSFHLKDKKSLASMTGFKITTKMYFPPMAHDFKLSVVIPNTVNWVYFSKMDAYYVTMTSYPRGNFSSNYSLKGKSQMLNLSIE